MCKFGRFKWQGVSNARELRYLMSRCEIRRNWKACVGKETAPKFLPVRYCLICSTWSAQKATTRYTLLLHIPILCWSSYSYLQRFIPPYQNNFRSQTMVDWEGIEFMRDVIGSRDWTRKGRAREGGKERRDTGAKETSGWWWNVLGIFSDSGRKAMTKASKGDINRHRQDPRPSQVKQTHRMGAEVDEQNDRNIGWYNIKARSVPATINRKLLYLRRNGDYSADGRQSMAFLGNGLRVWQWQHESSVITPGWEESRVAAGYLSFPRGINPSPCRVVRATLSSAVCCLRVGRAKEK